MRPRSLATGCTVSLLIALFARGAQAGWGPIGAAPPANAATAPTAPEAPAAPPASAQPSVPVAETPAALLAAADTALDEGDLARARKLFAHLISVHPASAEAAQARRALKVLTAGTKGPTDRAHAPPDPAPADVQATPEPPPVVMRQEPYSTRTSERLRLTTWEKLDFGITSFLYGMSIGASFAVGQNSNSADVTGPLALGALTYTLGAVAYLNLAAPDRGDLPLALAITSYTPTTVLLLARVAAPEARAGRVAGAVAVAGLVSVPIAIAVTRHVDLDPGDTQLVRDAGFWGLVLATTGTLAFGGETVDYGAGYSQYQGPSDRRIAATGLVGLFGGLGLGLLAATHSEISLERVRVTTWGGYGGALLGTLLGVSNSRGDRGAWGGLTIGALVGLSVTFLSTGSLDGIPPENAQMTASTWSPTLIPVRDTTGHSTAALGFSGAL